MLTNFLQSETRINLARAFAGGFGPVWACLAAGAPPVRIRPPGPNTLFIKLSQSSL